jgi:hydroxyacylglutathione hydrolase
MASICQGEKGLKKILKSHQRTLLPKPPVFVRLPAVFTRPSPAESHTWKGRKHPMTVKERFGRIVYIPGPSNGRYPFCNSLYIDDSRRTIIDAGSDEAFLGSLKEAHQVDMILNSHYHEDHIMFNYFFSQADLGVHEAEVPCYQSIRHLLDYYGLLGTKYEQAWRDILIHTFHYRERNPTVTFQDGDVFHFGRTWMVVVHTPGHSPGHCSFYFPDEGVLFLGDMDMTAFGPWYGDRVSDIDDTIASVHRLMKIPARIFISAHEAGIIEGDLSDKAEAYLAVIDEREKKLLTCLERPKTLDEIAGQWIMYKRPREPKYLFEFAERALVKKHLERLEKNRKVTRVEDRYALA